MLGSCPRGCWGAGFCSSLGLSLPCSVLLLSGILPPLSRGCLIRPSLTPFSTGVRCSLGGQGGDSLRKELERHTDIISNSSSSHAKEPSWDSLFPRTIVFCGPRWMAVMHAGSIRGLGLLADSSIRLCHCRGRPVNFCSCSSKPVCTRCSKLEGAEISIRFFFLANMVTR